MGFFSEFRREFKEGQRFEAAGIQVVCSHCGGEEFKRQALSGSTFMPSSNGVEFVGANVVGTNVTTLVCTRCGHVELFESAFGFNGKLSEIE